MYKCEFCEYPVNPVTAVRKVVGWVERRQQGGANAVRLREELGKYAHESCINREAKQVNANQTGLDV